jgi:hypothetical protein
MGAMKKSLFLAAVLGALGGTSRADEGRIPIATPTTISGPGHYVLTRNIEVASGDVITIDATHVTLDLNGHTISSTSTAGTLINIQPTADLLTIRNGRLHGGGAGITALSTVGLSLWMENLEIDAVAVDGISVSGVAHVELLHSSLINNGDIAAYIEGDAAAPVTGRFEGNTIGGSTECLALLRPRDVRIANNMITSCGQNGIQLGTGTGTTLGYGGNLVQDNVIAGCNVAINVVASTPGNQIVGNVLRQNGIGIFAASASNRIVDNTIQESTSIGSCGGGICITGPRNLVEENLIQDSAPGCAIRFSGASALSNAYRNNMLRFNAGGSACVSGGATATDAGGNIL